MSDICLQFGQCGNEVGFKFLDVIHKNEGEDRNKWFYASKKGDTARCILVDMECKVIHGLLSDSRQWTYDRKNAIMKSGGSGNNWALGYHENGPLLLDSVVEQLRLECEKSDYVRSLITFLSSGGGTGSGVGTYIINQLHDFFPNNYLISNITVPSLSGASPVQLYNSILSISNLIKSSDAMHMFYNDYLFGQCSQLYKDSEFKFTEMNSIISKQLCSLLHSYNGTSFIPDYIHKLIPMRNLNILSFKSFPCANNIEASHTYEPNIPWKSVIERLKSFMVINSDRFWDNQRITRVFSESKQKSSSYHRALSNIVICRGRGSGEVGPLAKSYFSSNTLYSERSVETDRFTFLHDTVPIHGQQQFSCIASNSALFNEKLECILHNSWSSYFKNAYIHHYEKYGIDENYFKDSFLKMENLIKEYKRL